MTLFDFTRRRGGAANAGAGCWLALLICLGAGGFVLSWNLGHLPRRAEPAAAVQAEPTIAPDLALYCEVIASVRAGNDYYSAAAEAIPRYGFPVSSPLNWRLPTYAWVLSWLPCPGWIQLALIGLSVVALALAVVAKARSDGPLVAMASVLVLFGVVRWAIDGYACVAQEPWAATLVLISLATHSLGASNWRWRVVAIAAGTAALLFRELALPYCAVALLVAVLGRRWWEAAGWGSGIAAFFAFFAWHAGQVQLHQSAAAGAAVAEAGIGQWLRLGGLDFVLLTTRMNGLLFAAPGFVLWLYLLAALVGLSHKQDETSRLACLAALGYLLVFAFLGRPENFYWGLLPAPLLAWGIAHAPAALKRAVASCEQALQKTNAAGSEPAALVS